MVQGHLSGHDSGVAVRFSEGPSPAGQRRGTEALATIAVALFIIVATAILWRNSPASRSWLLRLWRRSSNIAGLRLPPDASTAGKQCTMITTRGECDAAAAGPLAPQRSKSPPDGLPAAASVADSSVSAGSSASASSRTTGGICSPTRSPTRTHADCSNCQQTVDSSGSAAARAAAPRPAHATPTDSGAAVLGGPSATDLRQPSTPE